MNYTLSIRQAQGLPDTLILNGHLTIRNSVALHAALLEHSQKQEGMRLEVKEVEEMDAAFLQLLLALRKYHDEHKKPFYLHLALNPVLSSLVQIAGLSKTLNTNPS